MVIYYYMLMSPSPSHRALALVLLFHSLDNKNKKKNIMQNVLCFTELGVFQHLFSTGEEQNKVVSMF